MIALNPCKSSNILALGYDEATKTLAIQFKNATYHYPGVAKDTYEGLCKAPSIGSFFHHNIRGKHEGVKQPTEAKA